MTRILQYLKVILEMGLTHRKAGQCRLEAFADASHVEEKKYRHSLSGIVTLFGEGTLLLSTKKQAHVTLNSSEAEYVSLADCDKGVLHMRMLLEFFVTNRRIYG